jgi:hypothetical protein
MMTRKVTRPMIALWKRTWIEYRDRLRLERKSGQEVLRHLQEKYPLELLNGERALRAVVCIAQAVEPLFGRLAPGETPEPVAFYVKKEGAGSALYEKQDRAYRGCRIFVGIELRSGHFHVEGSDLLWDELCAFQGLDEAEKGNFYCVSMYVSALRRFGLLEGALKTEG